MSIYADLLAERAKATLPTRQAVVAGRRAEAHRQLVLAQDSRPEVVAAARAQFANTRRIILDGTVNAAPVGRNEPCPCGSGAKFKRCCGSG